MLRGRHFKLDSTTIAIELVQGKHAVAQIPAGAVVKVVDGPQNVDRMVDVLWEERTLMIFAIDLKQRGTEVAEESAGN